MRKNVALLLEAAGVAFVSVAGLLVDPALGFLAAGVGLVLFGLAVERS